MVRPKNCRRVAGSPGCLLFKPAGIPAKNLEEVVLGVDELEAIRLADKEGLYHEIAAEQMNISRQTFGRIVTAARNKVAQALIEGKVLRIEGGEIEMAEKRKFVCNECQHIWELPFGTGRPGGCPECKSVNIHRIDTQRSQPGQQCGRGTQRRVRQNRGGRKSDTAV
jgi:predicted DNA-binding protein (UPF0251 family)